MKMKALIIVTIATLAFASQCHGQGLQTGGLRTGSIHGATPSQRVTTPTVPTYTAIELQAQKYDLHGQMVGIVLSRNAISHPEQVSNYEWRVWVGPAGSGCFFSLPRSGAVDWQDIKNGDIVYGIVDAHGMATLHAKGWKNSKGLARAVKW